MTDTDLKILLIGAGNVAWHLGPALEQSGYNIIQVYSRTIESAEKLGSMMEVPFTDSLTDLSQEADLVLLSVSDEAIESITGEIQGKYTFLVHTAGSVPADVFEGAAEHYGVLYPLMTFTMVRPLDLRSVPICLEPSSESINQVLRKMASSLSDHVYHIEFEERKKLHIAAVIASNFSNHMYHLAMEFLSAEGLEFNMLEPLIRETVDKAMQIHPADAQTGPAKRDDRIVIESHLEQLKGKPELQKLYTFVSDSIRRKFSETNE